MGFQYRRRIRAGSHAWLNISKSGISASTRIGRVTVNSRGSVFVRIARGLFWRSR